MGTAAGGGSGPQRERERNRPARVSGGLPLGPGGLGAPLGCSLGAGAARRAAGLNAIRTGGPEVPLGRAGSPLSPAGLRPCCVEVRGDGALPGGAARPFP